MSSQTRRLVLWISAPVVAFAIVGGILSKSTAGQGPYQNLKIFDDVVSFISSNYVEKADLDKVMHGAMDGLADSLDPDSAFLSADQVKQLETGATPPAGRRRARSRPGSTTCASSRARDGSPAAKAGLLTGDYVRAIDDMPTREMSVWEGMRALRGAPGTKVKLTIIRGSAADPHVVELTRETPPPRTSRGRIAAPGVGYVRVAAIGAEHRRPGEIAGRRSDQGRRHAAHRRRPPHVGRLARRRHRRSRGCSSASGTLAIRETKGSDRETIAAQRRRRQRSRCRRSSSSTPARRARPSFSRRRSPATSARISLASTPSAAPPRRS